jgi:hypothetical protein
LDQPGASCCYAKSDKYWIRDPRGIAWETFRTLDSIQVFGIDSRGGLAESGACCAPDSAVTVKLPGTRAAKSSCC